MTKGARIGAKIEDNALNVVAETIDRLISLDFRDRKITGRLYAAARDHVGAPLAYAAALAISQALDPPRPATPIAGPEDSGAIICTGFMIRSAGQPETDGLTGAALLARGLAAAFGIVPVLATDDTAIGLLAAACRAADLSRQVVIVPFLAGSTPTAIRPFAADSCPSQPEGSYLHRTARRQQAGYSHTRGQSISDITAPRRAVQTSSESRGADGCHR